MRTKPIQTRPRGKFVAYYHGDKLDNQEAYLQKTFYGSFHKIIASYHETNKKRRYYKPELHKALARCKRERASLVIPIMGNLAYNTIFLEMMLETDVKVFACDLKGTQEVDIHLLASVSDAMREDISRATKRKLQKLKKEGVQLGASDWRPGNKKSVQVLKDKADEFAMSISKTIKELRSLGYDTYDKLADRLNDKKIKTQRGGKWHASTVRNIEVRLEELDV